MPYSYFLRDFGLFVSCEYIQSTHLALSCQNPKPHPGVPFLRELGSVSQPEPRGVKPAAASYLRFCMLPMSTASEFSLEASSEPE